MKKKEKMLLFPTNKIKKKKKIKKNPRSKERKMKN